LRTKKTSFTVFFSLRYRANDEQLKAWNEIKVKFKLRATLKERKNLEDRNEMK
jgi:hypothetical protein